MSRPLTLSVFSEALPSLPLFCFFFFNDTATTEIYTLSLHDALPISWGAADRRLVDVDDLVEELVADELVVVAGALTTDRKSTRLNSSHGYISYAVFCLKKKKKKKPCRDMDNHDTLNRVLT